MPVAGASYNEVLKEAHLNWGTRRLRIPEKGY